MYRDNHNYWVRAQEFKIRMLDTMTDGNGIAAYVDEVWKDREYWQDRRNKERKRQWVQDRTNEL